MNNYPVSQNKKSKKRVGRLRTLGLLLMLFAALLFVLSGKYADRLPYLEANGSMLPAAEQPFSSLQSNEAQVLWAKWLEADAPALEQAYYIQSLSETERNLCKGLYQAISNFEPEIHLAEPIQKDLLNTLMWLMKYDCPELFQISGDYTYYVLENEPSVVLSVKPTYILTPEEYALAMQEVNAVLSAWQAEAEGLDMLATEKLIYDNLMRGCVFEEEGLHAGNAYGALVHGKARCEGYSQALNLALRRTGMDCVILTGEARTPPTEQTEEKIERHAWNAAKIGDHFYQLDATWDDLKSDNDETPVSYYAYFNVTDEEMYKNRTLDDLFNGAIKAPRCSENTYNYFVYTGAYVESEADTKKAFYAILDQALANKQYIGISTKFQTHAQLQELEDNFADWMQEWYQKKKFRSGAYGRILYQDTRTFCITSLEFTK